MQTNERLRAALIQTGNTPASLADLIGADPKTVERWVTTNRIPHRALRLKAAHVLNADDAYLWPSTGGDPQGASASAAEFIRLYQNRKAIHQEAWRDWIKQATDSIDILAIAATFLHDSIDDTNELLRERADAGVSIRILLGDPRSEAVGRRGDEERIGDALRGRCQLAWSYFGELLDHDLVEGRRHNTTLYASMFRFDDDLLVNHHLYGLAAGQAPVYHYRRVPGGRMFRTYMASFERVWDLASARAETHV